MIIYNSMKRIKIPLHIFGFKVDAKLNKYFLNKIKKLSLSFSISIISFSTSYKNDYMWNSYTDKYKGACLEYSVKDNKIKTNSGIKTFFKVNYKPLIKFNILDNLCLNNNKIRRVFEEIYNKHLENKLILNGLPRDEYINHYYKNCLKISDIKNVSWSNENEYRLLFIGSYSNARL